MFVIAMHNFFDSVGLKVNEILELELEPEKVEGISNIISITAGEQLTIALRDDNTLWFFGEVWEQNISGERRREHHRLRF